mmetsp:Transcript_4482/g.6150  ORF Transcript_4482/g.6150 Transcript_4482/m.6150 type:complete len:723 (-) Transcript_4482:224-2392(-)
MGKQRRRRRKGKAARDKIDPLGGVEKIEHQFQDVSPMLASMMSTDPASRASACTAVGVMVLNSDRATALCFHLAKRGVVKRLLKLLLDSNAHVAVAAFRAAAKMAICGDNRVSKGLIRSDVLTPVTTVLTGGKWLASLSSDLRSILATNALELACCLAEQCEGVAAALTEGGGIARALDIMLDDSGGWDMSVRKAAGSLLSVASDDNERLARHLISPKNQRYVEGLIAVAQGGGMKEKKRSQHEKVSAKTTTTTATASGRRLRALCASTLLNLSYHPQFNKHRNSLHTSVGKALCSLIDIRPVGLLPQLAQEIHRSVEEESKAKVPPSQGGAFATWNGHREKQQWEELLDRWYDETVGFKVSLETLANLCSSSPNDDDGKEDYDVSSSSPSIVKALANEGVHKRLAILLEDQLLVTSAFSAISCSNNRDTNKVKVLHQSWKVLKSSVPTAQAVRIGRLLSTLGQRLSQCLTNIVLYLPTKDLEGASSLADTVFEWLRILQKEQCTDENQQDRETANENRNNSKSSSNNSSSGNSGSCISDKDNNDAKSKSGNGASKLSLLSQNIEAATALLQQMMLKKCAGIASMESLGLLAQLTKSGKSSTTRANCLMALAHAGLRSELHKNNLHIGRALLNAVDGHGDESLEVVCAAVEALIDLYSEDDRFQEETKQLKLVERLFRFIPVYEKRLKSSEEGGRLDEVSREHQINIFQNLQAFVQYKRSRS